MAIRTDVDMTKVSVGGDVPPEGSYRVRVSKVDDTQLSKKNEPKVELQLKIQDEGESFGRVIFDNASLQPQALFKLKAYYNAVGYNPGPEGHDPMTLLDKEMYV